MNADGTSGDSTKPDGEAYLTACHARMNTFEARVRATKSSRKNSESLLSLAKGVMGDIDQTLQPSDLATCERFAKKFCTTLDRADGVVRYSSQKSGVERFLSSILGPCAAGSDFNDVETDLHVLAAEVRNLHLPRKAGSGIVTFAPPPIPESMEVSTSQTVSLPVTDELSTRGTAESWRGLAPSSVGSPTSRGNTAQDDSVGLLPGTKRLRRSARQESISAMTYMPSRETETWTSPSGRVWLHVSRTIFGADKLLAYDLSNDVEQKIEGGKAEGYVTALHLDSRGIVWSGHRSGAVIAWREDERVTLCEGVRASSSPIRVITTDENDLVWVGSDKGDVRRLALVSRQEAGGVGYEVKLHRYLRHTNSGVPERSSAADIDPVTGMVKNLKAKDKAHEGAVASLAAASGKVWTAGGSVAFVCLREWTQRGEFLKKHDLKSIGAAVSMLVISPIVRVNIAPDPTSSLSSAISSVSSYRNPELPQMWQLLTGHANGVIQVWGETRGLLTPLLRIGGEQSPITAISVIEPLGLICSSHLDGRMVVRAVPHPNGQSALTVALVDGTISAIKMKRGELKVAESGVASMGGGPSGVVTAAYDASLVFWPSTILRQVVEEAGITIPEPSSLSEQWPLHLLKPQDIQNATQTLTTRPTAGAAGGLKFTDDASRWQIDYDDLTTTRVIGEGAFGKVYLGRWHETDVAIKVLSSLSALGLASGEASSSENLEAIKTLEREVTLMVSMRHPNVILFMGLCPEPPCVVTEYCSKGSLYDLLKAAKEDPAIARQLHWSRRLGFALDSAKGMLYLHSHKPPIIHRDLKSPNLLVDGHWRGKVTDFNLSRLSETPSVASSLAANNPRWQAPEIIHSRTFSAAGDVYAFGLILWELATWQLPFEQLSQFQIMLAVGEKGFRPEIPAPDSPALRGGSFPGYDKYVQLMEDCWAQNPAKRPGFDYIISILRDIAIGVGRAATQSTDGGESAQASLSPTQSQSSSVPAAVAAAAAPAERVVTAVPVEAPMSPFDGPARPPVTAAPVSPFDAPSARPAVTVAPVSPFDAPAATPAAAPPSPFDAPSTTAAPPNPFDAPSDAPKTTPSMVSPFDVSN